ncbi:polysaccharide deacetylase family protein [Paenibacillus sp. N1-5-1-14]|uniref:polysaccharide deacetylase family protein n=1 Tax=Paenibacillus radicibacter TaxID=2972488 RepID=UPI002159B5C8|nr:polysaccharide deacetylase family protein [Paenibacillus radicibacter]MCR8643727.1 polysaccharide deacetylase family protein [Paenibacillus radicibacter]
MRKFLAAILLISIVCMSVFTAPKASAEHPTVYYQDQVAVLMYHHFHDIDKSSSTMTPELFKRQLDYLLAKGYNFISMDDFKQYLDGATVPDNAILLTIDDGYQSVHEKALPILAERHIPGTVFMITETLANPKGYNIPFMNEEEMKELVSTNNFITTGCHTDAMHIKLPDGEASLIGRVTKADGTKETESEYKDRVTNDIKGCISKVNDSHRDPVDYLAYPFGIVDDLAASLVNQAGINYAFTIVPDMAIREVDRMHIPRINAGSPWITPEMLDFTIKQRVEAKEQKDYKVPVTSALTALGATVENQNGSMIVKWNEQQWTIRDNHTYIERTDGTKLDLRVPVSNNQGHLMMDWRDVQAMLGTPIMYHPDTKLITLRTVPKMLTS